MLVRSNGKIECAVNDNDLVMKVCDCALRHIGVDDEILGNISSITYVSTDDRKVIDCTYPPELTWLINELMSEHVVLVSYNHTAELKHTYVCALITESDHDEWYNIKYISIEIETTYPIETAQQKDTYRDILPFSQTDPIEEIDNFMYDEIFYREDPISPKSDTVSYFTDGDMLIFNDPTRFKIWRLKNPQHIMAELLGRRFEYLGWIQRNRNNDFHSGDYLEYYKNDQIILISCVYDQVLWFENETSQAIIPAKELVDTALVYGYKFVTGVNSADDARNVYNSLYLYWLYDKHSDDIKAIDDLRRHGHINGKVKRSPYCYEIWTDSGETALIQSTTSLAIVAMRELIANCGYTVFDISYHGIILRKKDILISVCTTYNPGDISIDVLNTEQDSSEEHDIAASYAVTSKYTFKETKKKDVKEIEPRDPYDSHSYPDSKRELIEFLEKHVDEPIVTVAGTADEHTEEFLYLKALLNEFNRCCCSGKSIDTQWKNPTRFFSAEKVATLLTYGNIPFEIVSASCRGVRTTKITRIGKTSNAEDNSNDDNGDKVDAGVTTNTGDDYNSIL